MGAAKNSKELELLKEQARELGISFSPNIGLESLKNKINIAMAKANVAEPEAKEENSDVVKNVIAELEIRRF